MNERLWLPLVTCLAYCIGKSSVKNMLIKKSYDPEPDFNRQINLA